MSLKRNFDTPSVPAEALSYARGLSQSKPIPKERGLGFGFPTMAGGLEDQAREQGYVLDFVTEAQRADVSSKQGRPYREPSLYAERLRRHGFAADFVIPDTPATSNLVGAEQDHSISGRNRSTGRAAGGSSSVEATYSDPRLTVRLQNGPGILFVGSTAQNVARAETVRAIEAVGEHWAALHPEGPRIRVGGIGVVYGGPLQRGTENGVPVFHKSHQLGVDADIRLMRNDGKEADTSIDSDSYSRELTAAVIDLFISQSILPVVKIFFNDPMVPGVQWEKGHHNHFHVRFERR